MFKITNIQAVRLIRALLILLSGNAFADTTYATVKNLSAETARATEAELAIKNTSPCTPYNWGDIGPDGGKVFYVDGSGCHGLEAQPADAAPTTGMTWANAISAAAAYNTTTITTALSCSTSAISTTPNCWRLPSKTELNFLWDQRYHVGNFGIVYYWSYTTGGREGGAWGQDFDAGTQGDASRYFPISDNHSVRPVRSF